MKSVQHAKVKAIQAEFQNKIQELRVGGAGAEF